VAARPPARALITGASSGIGAALARRIASRGVEVWLAARRQGALDAEVSAITAAGGRAHALVLDVEQADATAAAMEKLDDESGGIDLVIANAGIGGTKGGLPVSEAGWPVVREFMQVNLMGALATVVPFIPRMLARGHGHLVGVSSISADLPMPRTGHYGASKIGLTYFLECADMELRPRGVDVTIVHPGFVRTPLNSAMDEKLPLLMELDRAIDIIDAGLQRRARMVRFPWVSGAVARLVAALPRGMTSPIIRHFNKPGPQLPPKSN
jgi:short-subunit dehydrogenase